MSDFRITPPPPERMPPVTKDRIRAELRAATQSSQGGVAPSRRRWVAPALAAAAVLTIVSGVFGIAASLNDSGGQKVAPAASPSTSAVPTRTSPSANPSPSPPPVNGAQQYRTLAVREKLVLKPDGSVASDHFFAGGNVRDSVRAITYTFPDGRNVPATIRNNGVWSVRYSPTSGPLLDGHLDRVQLLDPIWAAVRYSNGYVDRIPLPWPHATCTKLPVSPC